MNIPVFLGKRCSTTRKRDGIVIFESITLTVKFDDNTTQRFWQCKKGEWHSLGERKETLAFYMPFSVFAG